MRTLLALALSLGAALPARAAAPPRVKVAVVVAGPRPKASPRGSRDTLSQAVRQALVTRPDVELLPAEREAFLFRSRRQRTGKKKSQLEQARRQLEQASAAFSGFDFAGAGRAVQRAGEVLEPWIGLEQAVELDRQRLQLAIAIAHAKRDDLRLAQAIGEYATRYPGESAPPGLWPPDVQNRVLSPGAEAAATLSVSTEPKALVKLDGRPIGLSPVRVGALPPGRHRLSAALEEHYPQELWIDAAPGKEAKVEIRLPPDLPERFLRLTSGPVPPDLLDRVRRHAAADGLGLLLVAFRKPDGRVLLWRAALGPLPPAPVASAESDATPAGLGLAVRQLFEGHDVPEAPRAVPLWAWVGGGAGVAAVGAGVALRLLAVGMQNDLEQQEGSLTQAQAFQMRDDTEARATQGTVLLGAGLLAVTGVAGYLLYQGFDP